MNKQYKKLLKLYKRHHKKLKQFGVPIVAGLAVFGLGMAYQQYRVNNTHPTNIVWAIDDTVRVPDDLKKVLLKTDDCGGYKGANSPKGIGLWAVVQIEQNAFAKLSYGCSWAINNQTIAVKTDNKWKLIKPVEYFSDTVQGVPNCTAVVKYKVPDSLEGFCRNDKGELVKNPNPR